LRIEIEVMGRDLPYELRPAESAASQLLKRFGVVSPEDIRLEDIAYALGLEIATGDISGSTARLVRYGDRGVIRISKKGSYEGKRRFSIAHEIGHFVLEHQGKSILGCSDKDFLQWYKGSPHEAAANVFASELLMPETMIRELCEVSPVNLNPIRKLSNQFDVSLTAAAIRFVRFASEMCAIVYAENGIIKWSTSSKDFWPRLLRAGSPLNKYSLAYDFFKHQKSWKEPEGVRAEAWLDDPSRLGEREIIENTFGSERFGYTLTILWLESR